MDDMYYPQIPLPPTAPENGIPVFPDPETGGPEANYPVPPIAPEPGIPVYPGPETGGPEANYPVPPIAPEPGIPVYPGPGESPGPIIPSTGASRVRFLHAAPNFPPFFILVGNRVVAPNLSYGNLSSYIRVASGFQTVTLISANAPRAILYRQTLPIMTGTSYTLAIVNTLNGIEVIEIPEYQCQNGRRGRACIRMANLSYNSCPLDLALYDGRVIFSDVRFKQVTPVKKIQPGSYNFYITPTPHIPMPLSEDVETVSRMPIPIEEDCVTNYDSSNPLTSFYADIDSNKSYTIYVMGLIGMEPYLRTLVVFN